MLVLRAVLGGVLMKHREWGLSREEGRERGWGDTRLESPTSLFRLARPVTCKDWGPLEAQGSVFSKTSADVSLKKT